MEIQTDLTKQDLIEFNLYHLSQSPAGKRRRLLGFLPGLVLIGFALLISAISAEPLRTAKALTPLFVGGISYIIFLFAVWRWTIPKQIQNHLAEGENKGILGPHKIIIAEDGVSDIGELSQSRVHWKAVERVVVTNDCAYIYVNALSAAVVPKRFFPTDKEFVEFAETAQGYHAQAATSPPSPSGHQVVVAERQPPPIPPP